MGVMFLNRLQLARQVRITNLIGVKVGHAHPHTVFHFEGADVVQKRSPAFVFRQVLGHMTGEKNVRDLELDLFFKLCRHAYFGAGDSASFWKRGSFRSGSNIGSSRSSAGVSGTPNENEPEYGVERSFCKAAMARSGSPMRAATRARISIGMGPVTASFSTGFAAIARSEKANAAALSPRPILVSARSPRRR